MCIYVIMYRCLLELTDFIYFYFTFAVMYGAGIHICIREMYFFQIPNHIYVRTSFTATNYLPLTQPSSDFVYSNISRKL